MQPQRGPSLGCSWMTRLLRTNFSVTGHAVGPLEIVITRKEAATTGKVKYKPRFVNQNIKLILDFKSLGKLVSRLINYPFLDNGVIQICRQGHQISWSALRMRGSFFPKTFRGFYFPFLPRQTVLMTDHNTWVFASPVAVLIDKDNREPNAQVECVVQWRARAHDHTICIQTLSAGAGHCAAWSKVVLYFEFTVSHYSDKHFFRRKKI